jgi:intracellular sulfur oxidation DsrE/DsrF family protein
VEQPRTGSKICVDITADSPADKVHPAIEKVARFVNIYAGAGKQPAALSVAVILHGGATPVALSDVAYREHLAVEANPNTQLVRELCDAGVEFVVCGQALAHKGFSPDGVTSDIKIAVSALTANVNRQADGYAVVQLK